LKSLVNTLEMTLHHPVLRLYDKIDRFISPSRFLIGKIREMGFGGEMVHLPNFVDLSRFSAESDLTANRICYFGRLSPEKGLLTLLQSVRNLDIELHIIGTGPQQEKLLAVTEKENLNHVRFLGYRENRELHREIASSLAVVLPSEWYENNPLSILEAFALKKPVIGADIGGIPELVIPGETGFIFPPGDADRLSRRISQLLSHPRKAQEMGCRAFDRVRRENNREVYYRKLMDIYRDVAKKTGN
jgi:glycosyltransferase involved in cell wall biosynthesis